MCWGIVGSKGGSTSVDDVIGEDFVTISVGREHACALRANGTGACWDGWWSEEDDLTPLDRTFKSISAGNWHTCALSVSGEAICWGDNDYGQSDPKVGPFVSISAGFRHTCAVKESGQPVCWGDDRAGQASPPSGLRLALPSGASSRQVSPSEDSLSVASVLARFSTNDPTEGETRSDAVGEIISMYTEGYSDREQVLDLLHTMSPELSINKRRKAADELGRIAEGGRWDENDTEEGAFYLATLIAGDEPNAGERVEAAYEMVVLYGVGELEAEHGLDLMNTIAPGLSINERRQAAAALARLSADDDWSAADKMEAASEVFRLVTGVPLNADERMSAAVDLAGVGVRVFDKGDEFDDRDLDAAAEIIKQSLSGDLTAESLESILSSGN